MTENDIGHATAAKVDFVVVENTERFRSLKRSHRSFVFPMAVFFLLWYFVYVLMAGWAPDFMATRVWGDVTVGLLFGLGQFLTTFVITMVYVSFANRKLDPIAAEIRADLEKQETGA